MTHTAAEHLRESVEIAKFWKTSRGREEAIIVALKEFKGHAYVDCRIFFTNAEGQLRPSNKGITIGLRRLSEFSRAITKAIATAVQLGLIDDEAAT